MSARRIIEFRDQARSYRITAKGLRSAEVRARYLGWAADLEQRADALELACDSVRLPEGEAGTAECEASQSGGSGASASPKHLPHPLGEAA